MHDSVIDTPASIFTVKMHDSVIDTPASIFTVKMHDSVIDTCPDSRFYFYSGL